MRSCLIPKTNLNASTISLGTGNFGGALDQKLTFTLLDYYVENGGNFLDTAKVYSDWRPGEKSISEKTIGLWLNERKNRKNIIVATKGAHPELTAMHIPRLSKGEIIDDLNASLRNLKIDVIDLYWLHRDDPNRPVEEIVDTLTEQVSLGKIKYFGCSNWKLERIQKAQNYAQKMNCTGFVANQPYWNLAQINFDSLSDKTMVVMDEKTEQYHLQSQMACVPYSSQANGWFQKIAANSVSPGLQKTYSNAISEERFKRVRKLSIETGLSISQITLGYLTSQPFPVFPIIGVRNLEMLKDSLAASNVTLGQDQIKFLKYSK